MNRTCRVCFTAGVALFGVLVMSSGAAFGDRAATAGVANAKPADGLKEEVVAAERHGLDALKAGDVAEFGRTTAEEAVFVDDRGPATKAEVMKNVAGFRLTDYAMEDIRFVAVSENTGLIAYKITEKGDSHGHEFSAQVYVSSVWTKRGKDWLCLFSQETAARKPLAAASN